MAEVPPAPQPSRPGIVIRILAWLQIVARAWWLRFVTAKGGRKAVWGCLPFLGLCLFCSVAQVAGQRAGLVAIAPTRTLVPTNTSVPTRTVAPTRTSAPTATIAPSATVGPTRTPVPTGTATPVPTNEPTQTLAPTEAPPTPTAEPTSPPAVVQAPQPTKASLARAGVRPTGKSCPVGYPIKGNNSKKNGKLYHLPGEGSYDATTPEQCFATAADAEAAGYVYSRR